MEDVKKTIVKFTKDRDWDQFHSPTNLAKSIAIESGELLECFQWNDNFNKEDVCDELADVRIYAILLADKLDVNLEEIIMKKWRKIPRNIPLKKQREIVRNTRNYRNDRKIL